MLLQKYIKPFNIHPIIKRNITTFAILFCFLFLAPLSMGNENRKRREGRREREKGGREWIQNTSESSKSSKIHFIIMSQKIGIIYTKIGIINLKKGNIDVFNRLHKIWKSTYSIRLHYIWKPTP